MRTDARPTPTRTVLRSLNAAIAVVGLFLASCIVAPQLLAFPYRADIGDTRVYAETPIDQRAMGRVLARADARLSTSPLDTAPVGTRVFLTNSGWRWRMLALVNADSVGLTRPWSDLVSDAVIIARQDVANDRVYAADGGERSLSGVIAHERTHVMVRRHLGLIRGTALPRWISEGYADHVAGESRLTAADVARLRAKGSTHPAIFYFESRQRVRKALADNGDDVDALLRSR